MTTFGRRVIVWMAILVLGVVVLPIAVQGAPPAVKLVAFACSTGILVAGAVFLASALWRDS